MIPIPVSSHTARRIGLALFAMAAPNVEAQTLAFPGAEGFGRFASGGRGGNVYIVTNLNDSGPGSLRDAVANRNASTPRTVVFAVSGTIYLNSTLRISQGNLTIAGQTAPGDGICLAHYTLNPSNAENVIIRFIRSRLGDVSGVEDDAFMCRYASNMIIDHCSFSWSVDETASSYDNTNFTMQWCIVSESLRDSVHSKGNHGYGAIWGGLGATFHHNLIAHHDSRNPRFNGARTHGTANELVDMRNNVMFNWRGNTTYGGEPSDAGLPARHNMINNTYKPGPATGSGAIRHRILEPTRNTASTGSDLSLFHISGNHTTSNATVTADNWAGGVQVVSASEFPAIRADEPFAVPPVITQSAQDSFELVLANAGCRVPARDSVDTRVVSEVRNGTFTHRGSKGDLAGIIDSQNDVGGWPALASLPAPVDTDQDGMPDAWETARGLNPLDTADRNTLQANGYTNLEIYLNELSAPAFPVPQLDSHPQSQTLSAGAALSLSVTASGPGPFSYQWHLGGDPIEDATGPGYALPATTPENTGEYSVVVTNSYGSVRSDPAQVVFDNQPPEIIGEPTSMAVEAGQAVAFSASAVGAQPMSYQWYRGERAIPGATGPSLDLGPATFTAAGPYQVVVTNPHGADTSSTAMLSVTSFAEAGLFSTGFSADTIHAESPVVGPTSTNWHIMSSKDARSSEIENSNLDLTMPATSSGLIETAARFSMTPATLETIGKKLRLRVVLVTTNVRTLGIGIFDSGDSPPHTELINSQLTGGSSTLATGGTQVWNGYRVHLDANAAAVVHEGRPAQPGTTNASQSLIVPGTSSSAPTVVSIGSTPAAGWVWADDATHTLTFDLERTSADSIHLSTTIHAGTDTSAPALATGSATTPDTDLSAGFDALAIGFRNRDSSSSPRLRVTEVSVQLVGSLVTISDAYEAFLFTHSLDPETLGAPGEDPESDGVPNSLEFIFGGDPKHPGSSVLPVILSEEGWRYRFLKHIDTSTVFDLAVERSSLLSSWEPLEHGVGGVTITELPFNSTHDQVDVTLPADPGPSFFLRLAAEPRSAQ